jgi:Icc-related predicted phosphoesterase
VTQAVHIRVLSDLHEEFAARVGGTLSLEPTYADVTVLAGDIHNGLGVFEVAQRDAFANSHVVLVAGNHEYFGGDVESLQPLYLQHATPRLHPLQMSSVDLLGLRFVGVTLWTDYALYGNDSQEATMVRATPRMADYRLVRRGAHPDAPFLDAPATVQLHQQQLAWLKMAVTHSPLPVVVVTHHAPSPRSIHARFANDPINPAFITDLEYFMLEQPEGKLPLWIHGHVHNGFDYRVGGTRVVANPAGYRRKLADGTWLFENTAFDPNKIVEVSAAPNEFKHS